MIIASLAAVAALLDPAAQAAAPPVAPLNVEIPPVAGATGDPTCGGRTALAERATCVATTQAGAEGLMDAYDAAFTSQGWLAAGGRDNLVVYVRRRPAGGCDAFQVLAFAEDNATAAPAGPAWIAFAAIPGDICHAQAAASTDAPAQ